MKKIEVVAAVIRNEGKILATQRGYGEFEGKWEFPGGKVEPGETREAALAREIREELGVEIVIKEFITTVDYDYPHFHLTMHCYLCEVNEGKIELLEHAAGAWLAPEDLDTVDWLDADIDVVANLKRLLMNK